MKTHRISKILNTVLSELLGSQYEVLDDRFVLDVEYEAEPGICTLVIKVPLKKAFRPL